MPDRLEVAVTAAEETVAAVVSSALDDVAAEYAAALETATELVAARFSVSRIARMWGARVPAIVRRLLGVAETAANRTADDTDTQLPDGWDDLPGRYDDGRDLPPSLGDYVTDTEHLLRAVGARLATTAVGELAAGLDAGEDIDQLRARLRGAFARDGAQLGDAREDRIARTEAVRAWNTATLAAAQDVTGPDRPLVKQWLTRRDTRVRDAHQKANGQLRLLDEPFTVAGVSMAAPGDPSAPPELVINCRCVLKMARSDRTAAFDSQVPPRVGIGDPRKTGMDPTLTVTAASGEHTGAMLALLPREDDTQRLALNAPGAEPADQLHLTLYYLGEGADWAPDHRADLIARLRDRTRDLTPISARAFGGAHWNGDGDDPCWVWSIGDDRDTDGPGLDAARTAATSALEDMHHQPELPAQHSPWQPHVCAAYSSSPALLTELESRLGEITFDRIRVAFAGEYTDIPLGPPEEAPMDDNPAALTAALASRRWSTPGETGIAFENQETGDGRVFAPGSLFWEGGPWPLQYADEMLMGHEGAELAGAIENMGRSGDRITADGVLYLARPAGADAVTLLQEGAPLGISVDLDDVDVEFVDRTMPDNDGLVLAASLASASVLHLDDGSVSLTAATAPEWTASGLTVSRSRHAVQLITGPGGTFTADAVRTAFAGTGALTAAAGDTDNPDSGTVVHSESSGDLLLRITRARVRGATLVAMPAYDRARIVLDEDDQEQEQPAPEVSAAGPGPDHHRVVAHVSASPVPVGAREVAHALGMSMETARGHLTRAAEAGRIVRLARGQYVGASSLPEGTEVSASLSGDTDLPVHGDRDAEWDGDAAASRVLDWATGDADTVDADRLGRAFLYRDPDADPATLAAYKLGYADIVEGELRIIARGVFALGAAFQGARGGVDVPEDERDALRDRAANLYERLADAYDDPELRAPWAEDMGDLEASAWTAMRDTDPMPAAWFREPTPEELPAGSGGVHYAGGRIYGWVAQTGEPHAGFPGRNLTVESLGDLDLTHFLRARFQLDDGSLVRAGAFTMNVGHHRDGAECETDACQFDDTRTVAGIVTVGQNAGGLWFSGAAAPWLSEWDRSVFTACQPSYHMKQGPAGRWQLRAVLSVPVPGHSSPLLATAVAERANLALAASASGLLTSPDTTPGHEADASGQEVSGQSQDASGAPTGDVAALTAALTDPAFLDGLLTALEGREAERTEAARAEVERLAATLAPAREVITASAAGGTTTREGDA
ncbi:phage minor head protein [Streptomyces diacarni]|uniref:phage minor head protein n=1 Tax=Streptomyces diacarni TaxID=2800381 RepID=UPI0033C40880